MKKVESSKVSKLIDNYIELARACNWDDSQIIEVLTTIFERTEIEQLGFSSFIRDYFDSPEGYTEVGPAYWGYK